MFSAVLPQYWHLPSSRSRMVRRLRGGVRFDTLTYRRRETTDGTSIAWPPAEIHCARSTTELALPFHSNASALPESRVTCFLRTRRRITRAAPAALAAASYPQARHRTDTLWEEMQFLTNARLGGVSSRVVRTRKVGKHTHTSRYLGAEMTDRGS
jgi:hypothetical protein